MDGNSIWIDREMDTFDRSMDGYTVDGPMDRCKQ